ncbi:NAD(P)-dependent dehydrogenase (short-subunit alcohol dehydrogenase family) [Amorphus suaedae]
MQALENRVALVTGAAGGIGRACALALAESGCRVAATDLDASALDGLVSDVRGAGGEAMACRLDVTDEASVASAFDTVGDTLGQVAVLVLCAGIMSEGRGAATLADIELDEWERIQAVNTRGTFLCIREYLRRHRDRPVTGGRIVTLSSAAAQLGGYRGDPCYVASKAAILGLTKIAARQVAGSGVTVNCVAAGPVKTAMFDRAMDPAGVPGLVEKIPMGRVGAAADVAAAVSYLVGEGGAWVTGATIDVNGGYRMQ